MSESLQPFTTAAAPNTTVSNSSNDEADDLVEADGTVPELPNTGTKFEIEGPWNMNDPVHENLTIAALARSIFRYYPLWQDYQLSTLDMDAWEYVRGVMWNDDPRCLLFKYNANSNHVFSNGYGFIQDFNAGKGGARETLTQRSHFGDLQFLHAMGVKVGEQPAETKRKIFVWIKVMYQVWRGYNWGQDMTYVPLTLVQDTELVEFFPVGSIAGKMRIADLLLGETGGTYNNGNASAIMARALGSCLHIIQDSFAQGHCSRRDSPTDVYSTTVANFHCYIGQDSDLHAKYDKIQSGWLNASLDARKASDFKSVIGGPLAIQECINFIQLYQRRDQGLRGLQEWFDQCFALDPQATPSDNSVEGISPTKANKAWNDAIDKSGWGAFSDY